MWQLLFAAGLFLVCALDSAAADSEGPVYVEVGGTAVLHPGSTVSGNINSATWKHGADKAAELYGGDVTCYRQFKGRCELNTTTGELTIKDLTLSDSGSYSAEINLNKVNTVQLQVMYPVPKPLVSTWCDPTKTYCLLTCEGNTSVPESVQYRWNKGDVYSISSKVLNITKENEEPEFSCEMKNPVSSRRSDPVQNPLITGNSSGIIIAVVVSILLLVFVVVAVAVAVVVYCKRKGTWTAPQDRVPHPPGNLWSRLRDSCPIFRTTGSQPSVVQLAANGPETTELLLQSGGDQQESNGGVHSLPPDDGSSPVVSSSASPADDHHESDQNPESSASNTDTVAVKMEVSAEDCGVSAESSKEAGAGAEQTLKETEDLVPEGRGVEPASSGAGLSVTVDVHPEPAQNPGASGSSASSTGSGRAADEEEPGETTELLPKTENGDQQTSNGGVHSLPDDGSSPVVSSSAASPGTVDVHPEPAQDPGAAESSASNPDTGRAADEEEPGETMELLSESGGDQQESSSDLHSPPDDGSPPVASSSGEDNLSTEKPSGFSETSDQDQDQDQDLTCSPEITKDTTEETSSDHEGPEQH